MADLAVAFMTQVTGQCCYVTSFTRLIAASLHNIFLKAVATLPRPHQMVHPCLIWDILRQFCTLQTLQKACKQRLESSHSYSAWAGESMLQARVVSTTCSLCRERRLGKATGQVLNQGTALLITSDQVEPIWLALQCLVNFSAGTLISQGLRQWHFVNQMWCPCSSACPPGMQGRPLSKWQPIGLSHTF